MCGQPDVSLTRDELRSKLSIDQGSQPTEYETAEYENYQIIHFNSGNNGQWKVRKKTE